MLPLLVHTLAGETFSFPELRHTDILLALGPPGGGKGTDFKHCVGALLERKSACVITQSAILTSAQLDSAFSNTHRRIITHSLANDILTPDHIAMNVLGRELALRLDSGVKYDFVAIDGGGRSLGQALGLANSGAKIYVINLEYSDTDEELLLARMQSRARNPRELDSHYNLQRLRQFEEVTVPGITKLRTLVSSMQWLDVPCSLEKEERHRLEMQFLNRAFGLVETVEAVAA
jgi:hypothetical protein